MDEKITDELLDEFLPLLETLDTQNTAILHFLKDQGIAADEKLAPYLVEAGNASNVRFLAVRIRLKRLLSDAAKAADKAPEEQPAKAEEKKREGPDMGAETTPGKQPDKVAQHAEKTADDATAEKNPPASTDRGDGKPDKENGPGNAGKDAA